jgi:hypothetical protein
MITGAIDPLRVTLNSQYRKYSVGQDQQHIQIHMDMRAELKPRDDVKPVVGLKNACLMM